MRAAALATVKEVRVKDRREALDLTDELVRGAPRRHKGAARPTASRSTKRSARWRPSLSEGRLRRPRTRIEGFSMLDENDQIGGSSAGAAAPDVRRRRPVPAHVAQQLGARGRERGDSRRPNVPWLVPKPVASGDVDSLGIAYRDDERQLALDAPRLRVLSRRARRDRASIVDPHGHHLDDAKLKLKALASFAERYGDEFHRIDAVDKIGNDLRVLNMKRADVRAVVLSGRDSAEQL